mgnify:CR=1 FL=1
MYYQVRLTRCQNNHSFTDHVNSLVEVYYGTNSAGTFLIAWVDETAKL